MPRSVDDPLTSHRANVDATLSLLVAARDARVKRVVFAGSSSAYGDTPTLPKHEDMPSNPLSPYALQKLVGEQYLQLFTRLYGLETVTHPLLQRLRPAAGSVLAVLRRDLAVHPRAARRRGADDPRRRRADARLHLRRQRRRRRAARRRGAGHVAARSSTSRPAARISLNDLLAALQAITRHATSRAVYGPPRARRRARLAGRHLQGRAAARLPPDRPVRRRSPPHASSGIERRLRSRTRRSELLTDRRQVALLQAEDTIAAWREQSQTVVIGGGPAGASAARLLAAWGHDVRLIARPVGGSRTAGGVASSELPEAPRSDRRSRRDRCGRLCALDGQYRLVGKRRGPCRAIRRRPPSAGRSPPTRSTPSCWTRPQRAGARHRSDEGCGRRRSSRVDASIILDCTGRAGLVARARGWRVYEPALRTDCARRRAGGETTAGRYPTDAHAD